MPTIQRTQPALFKSIPQADGLKLFDKGRANPERVKEILDYTKEDISVAAGIPLNSVRYDAKMPSELKDRLLEWATAINLVHSYFKSEGKTMLWFKVPNPSLGDISPRDMIRLGRFNKLLRFIQVSIDENQG